MYPDRWFRIFAYPVLGFFIRMFGEMAALGYLLKQPLFYLDVLWNSLEVAVIWEINRRFILYLDEHHPWTHNKLQRFLIQFGVGIPMSFVILVPMVYLYNEVLTDHGNFDTANLFVMDLPLTIVFSVMVHMLYTGMFFQNHYTTTIQELQNRIRELEVSAAGVSSSDELNSGNSSFRDVLILNYGSSSVPVKTHDIAYIYKQNEVSFIRTFEGKEFTSSSSLDNLEALLEPASFFRINRQMIGNARAIRQFRPDAGGKLVLTLSPAFDDEVSISKKKASEFREWIGSSV